MASAIRVLDSRRDNGGRHRVCSESVVHFNCRQANYWTGSSPAPEILCLHLCQPPALSGSKWAHYFCNSATYWHLFSHSYAFSDVLIFCLLSYLLAHPGQIYAVPTHVASFKSRNNSRIPPTLEACKNHSGVVLAMGGIDQWAAELGSEKGVTVQVSCVTSAEPPAATRHWEKRNLEINFYPFPQEQPGK